MTFPERYYNLFVLMTFVALVVVGGFAFVRWRRGYVSAGFYFAGITGMLAGFVLHSAFADYHPLDIGFIWEALMFFAAIAYRFVVVTRERERALGETLEAKEAVLRENALRIQVTESFNKAFARFVPREFLEQLGRRDVREVVLGDHVERDISVLFCDIRSFVALSEELKPRATFAFLNRYFGRIGPIVRANKGFIDQYLGDGVKALFPQSSDDAIRAAIALHREVRRFNEVQAVDGARPIDIGVALHRGPLILATIGESERYDTTVVTEVVNVAARLEGLTKVYGARIIVSEAVLANAAGREAYTVRSLGDLQVLGSALTLKAYEICDGDPPELLACKRSTVERFDAAIADYQAGHFGRANAAFRDIAGREPRDVVASFFAARSRRHIELGIVRWDGIDRHESKT